MFAHHECTGRIHTKKIQTLAIVVEILSGSEGKGRIASDTTGNQENKSTVTINPFQ